MRPFQMLAARAIRDQRPLASDYIIIRGASADNFLSNVAIFFSSMATAGQRLSTIWNVFIY